jgi:hypothetical protein
MREQSGAILARRKPWLRSQISTIFLDLRDILKGVGTAMSLEYRGMFHHSTAGSDCTNLELPPMTVLENRAAECCCARFPDRMVDYVADNAAVPEEAHVP